MSGSVYSVFAKLMLDNFRPILPLASGRCSLWLMLLLAHLLPYSPAHGEQVRVEKAPPAAAGMSLDTDAVSPLRFVAVHGRKALVAGYSSAGLEVWAYPLQIVSGYDSASAPQGGTTEITGTEICRTITYEPQAVSRTYIGPNFIVKERIFVPLEEPAAIFTYTVESLEPVEIVVHFQSSLNLMWPAALGGQSTRWSAPISGYLLSEGTRQFSGFIASRNAIAHDEIFNSAGSLPQNSRPGFTLRAGGKVSDSSAEVVVGGGPAKTIDASSQIDKLLRSETQMENAALTHYATLAENALRIVTPDETVNKNLAWAEVALDQAWVCNPDLGCGSVGGYGPSRGARRPQYAWFFAGDGAIAADALVDTGQFVRAREELEFITKYQDPKNGMLWHELSQSAGLLDWAGRYPYMYVHVDISFDYLNAVARYVHASGDVNFLTEHWSAIEAAYGYCRSLLDPTDGLPRIPSAKEGGNEQDRLTDDINLSVSWVSAARAYGQMAAMLGHATEASAARQLADRAAQSARQRYWDPKPNFWIDGYNEAGVPVRSRRTHGASLISNGIISDTLADTVLDQLASSDFQTDWGTRSMAASSADYDPTPMRKAASGRSEQQAWLQLFGYSTGRSQHSPSGVLSCPGVRSIR